MITYAELQARQQAEVNSFPLMWAFGREQFEKMLKENGLTVNDIISIGAGGYVRKSDYKAMQEMFRRHKRERKEALKHMEFLEQAILKEMANHEYCITYDREEVLAACGISEDEYESNEDIRKAWRSAERAYAKQA